MKRTSLSTLIVAIACVFTGQRRVAASDRAHACDVTARGQEHA